MPLPTQRMQNGRLLFGLHEMKSSPIEGLTISNITSERQNDIVGDFLSEILRLSETPTCRLSVEAALKKLGVLNPDEQLIFHRDLAAWHRSGAETYSCSAELTIAGASGATLCRTLICKAVFTFGPLSDQSLSRWLERYALLAENGVQVPHVYFADRGVIVQDYIEHSLPDFLAGCSAETAVAVATQIHRLAQVLDKLGFLPVMFIPDLRIASDSTCFVVDVGEDLGPPGRAPKGARNSTRQAEEFFAKLGGATAW